MMGKTDEAIMVNYLEGDTKALEVIYERYKIKIFNFCFRMLSNRADAEDITADVFLALFKNKYQYDPAAKFSTWLFTVARNNCISRIRHRKKMQVPWINFKNERMDDLLEIPDTQHLSREELIHKETMIKVKRAIGKLPSEQKEALILREYHQFHYEEISQVMNCSLEKVKILIFRAREQLKGELTSYMKEDRL